MKNEKKLKRRSHKLKKINKIDPETINKIDELLILLVKKIKQDRNNTEFYNSYTQSLLIDIHKVIKQKEEKDSALKIGGGNLIGSITQLLLLLKIMNTSLSSSLTRVTQNDNMNIDIQVRSIPTYTSNTLLSSIKNVLSSHYSDYVQESKYNVLKYKESEYIKNSVNSFNRHYVSIISNGGSKVSTASRITTMCRDVFLGSDVQTLLKNPEPPTLSSLFYTTTEATTNNDDLNTDFNSFCELSFPIPYLYIDEQENAVKLRITNSLGYSKIADMLDILYKSISFNNLGDDINLKIQKLKYLIKRVRYIEDSARQPELSIDKFTNIFNRVQDFLSSFENIETIFGDPELLDESIRNGLKNSFDTYLINQATEQNSIMARNKVNAYVLPFFSGVSSVSKPTIEFFTDSLETILNGIHFDERMRTILLYVMGIVIGCVGIVSYANANTNNKVHITKKELQANIKELLQAELKNSLDSYSSHLLTINDNTSNIKPIQQEKSQNKLLVDNVNITKTQHLLVTPEGKLKRCKRGTRRDKKTGGCVSNNIIHTSIKKQKRCERGTRKNKKTGECVPNKIK
jgi:hypothetical protein